FGEREDPNDIFGFGAPVLWALHPRSSNGRALLIPVYLENFVEAAINGTRIKGIDCSEAVERARRVLLVVHRPHYPQARPRWDKPFTQASAGALTRYCPQSSRCAKSSAFMQLLGSPGQARR
ncbi:MAG: hypothetical protein ACREEV_05395, partial [Dongiaceae bacterium]